MIAFTAELLNAGSPARSGTVGDALCESTIGLFKSEAISIGGAGLDRPTRGRVG